MTQAVAEVGRSGLSLVPKIRGGRYYDATSIREKGELLKAWGFSFGYKTMLVIEGYNVAFDVTNVDQHRRTLEDLNSSGLSWKYYRITGSGLKSIRRADIQKI